MLDFEAELILRIYSSFRSLFFIKTYGVKMYYIYKGIKTKF